MMPLATKMATSPSSEAVCRELVAMAEQEMEERWKLDMRMQSRHWEEEEGTGGRGDGGTGGRGDRGTMPNGLSQWWKLRQPQRCDCGADSGVDSGGGGGDSGGCGYNSATAGADSR